MEDQKSHTTTFVELDWKTKFEDLTQRNVVTIKNVNKTCLKNDSLATSSTITKRRSKEITIKQWITHVTLVENNNRSTVFFIFRCAFWMYLILMYL